MKKIVLAALVLAGALFLAPPARAQFTTVSATVQDPNGIPYAGGRVVAQLVPSTSGPWRLSGQPYAGQIPPATLGPDGSFQLNFGSNALITPAGTQWAITVSSNPGGIAPPLGTGSQSFTVTLTISGATQSITSQLDAAAPKLTNFITAAGVTSISGTTPIVATPSPIVGVGALSCPTCVTATGGGSVTGTVGQIGVFSGTNALGGSANLTSDVGSGDINQVVNASINNIRGITESVTGDFLFESYSSGIYSLTAIPPTFTIGAEIELSAVDGSIVLSSQTATGIALIDEDTSGNVTLQPVSGVGVTNIESPVTVPNCSSSTGVCGASISGAVSIAAAATTVVVATTAVTAASDILVTYDSSNSTRLSVTCNATIPALYGVTARVPGTSFTITATAPITNPACFSFLIFN